MSAPDPLHLSIQTERALRLPSSESEELIAVPMRDWEYFRKRVSKLPAPIANVSTLAGACFGATLTTFLTWITLISAEDAELKPWVIPAFAEGTVFFLILTIVFVCIHLMQRKKQKSETADICEEMDAIKARYERGEMSSGS